MTPHMATLGRAQLRALRILAPLADEAGFYLAGGTALALWLGHRRSVDLDWFTSKPIPRPSDIMSKIMASGSEVIVSHLQPGTLIATVAGVSTSFFEYQYPLLAPPGRPEEFNCSFASLDDIAAMKLLAIAERGARKDLVDLYALGTKHRPLRDLFDLYQRKFGTTDIAHLFYALNYFDDADRERMPTMLWRVNWRTIKATIRGWVKDLAGPDRAG